MHLYFHKLHLQILKTVEAVKNYSFVKVALLMGLRMEITIVLGTLRISNGWSNLHMAIEFIKKQIIRSYSNGELKDYFSADYHNFNYHGKHTNSDKFDMQFINDLSFTLSSLISILKNKKNQFYYSYVEEIIQKNIKNYHKFEHYKYLKIGIFS